MVALRISAAFFVVLAGTPALAVNPKQAVEGCRESVGKPIVMACMRAGGGNREACREKAKPKVQAAMARSLPKQAAPKAEETLAPADIAAAPASLLASPRTVADVSAILDQGKPDPVGAEQLRADGKGFPDASGNTEFTYAHPLFWAPYTIIGDGGRR